MEIAPRARRDLIEIGDYLERVSSRRIAQRWVMRLESRALGLGELPYSGAEDPELGGRRRIVVRPYLIIYRVADGVVHITRIVHGARDLPALFADAND